MDCIYTAFVDPESRRIITLVDADITAPYPIGCFDSLAEYSLDPLRDPTVGIPAFTSNNEKEGYLATAGAPVFDTNGQVICYALVDISMTQMVAWRHRMLTLLLGIQFLLTILVSIGAAILVNRSLVRPINLLSQASVDFCSEDDLTSHGRFAALDIHTGDEIEILAASMKQMESDLNDKISNLLRTTNELFETRKEADELTVLAKRDALTGIRNKLAYEEELENLRTSLCKGDDRFGMAVIDLNNLKKVNDSYGHEKGDRSIVLLCQLVCEIFAHSPVFRIGGDEFVVILRGHDYEQIDSLTEQFHAHLQRLAGQSDLPLWEQLSAAIGIAFYDPAQDAGVEDTFRRADQAMYARKQEMKNSRT